MPKKKQVLFETDLKQGFLLKKALDAAKDLFSMGLWECSESGLSLQAMDTAHVAFVTLELGAEAFSRFHCDRNFSMGMNLAAMAKVLGCASSDDIVTMKAKEDPVNLTLVIKSPSEKHVSSFDIKLLRIDADHLTIPDTAYDVVVSMASVEFQKIIRVMLQIGESLEIACTRDTIRFSTSGDLGTGSVRLISKDDIDDEERRVHIEMSKPIAATFALKYLNSFVKATPLSEQVSLSMAADFPLVVQYDIEDLGPLRFYLAPKVESSETY